MADYHVSPAFEGHVNQTSSDNLNVAGDKHHSSEGGFSPEITPTYERDIDLEHGIEKRRAEFPLAEKSSIDSPPKIEPGEEIEQEDEEDQPGIVTRYWRKYRPFGHAIIWLLFTAYFYLGGKEANKRWWICGLVLHREKWLIPFLLYLAVTLWLVFRYVSTTVLSEYSLLVYR
jgi:hypothetical protein